MKGLEVHTIHRVLLVALSPAGSVGAVVISAPQRIRSLLLLATPWDLLLLATCRRVRVLPIADRVVPSVKLMLNQLLIL